MNSIAALVEYLIEDSMQNDNVIRPDKYIMPI